MDAGLKRPLSQGPKDPYKEACIKPLCIEAFHRSILTVLVFFFIKIVTKFKK